MLLPAGEFNPGQKTGLGFTRKFFYGCNSIVNYINLKVLIDPGCLYTICLIEDGGGNFLYKRICGSAGDLYIHFHTSRDVDLVFVAEYLIKPEGEAAIILPIDAEPHHQLK